MPRSWIKMSVAERNNTELLIKTVEKYPAVWDTRHRDYQNAKLREIAWGKICATVIPDWHNCKNQLYKCLDLKKKWTHVRDYYRKRLQIAKNSFDSTGDVSFRTRYVYEDLLHYIKPVLLSVLETRDDEGCTNEDSNLEPAAFITLQSSCSPLEVLSLPSATSSPAASPAPSPGHSSPAPSSPVRKRFKNEPSTSEPSVFFNPLMLEPENVKVESEDDDDAKFLLSFRRYMRKMSDEQKVEFQIGMLQLVKKTFWEKP